MLGRDHEIFKLFPKVREFDRPVLSLYLTGPSKTPESRQALNTRIQNTWRELRERNPDTDQFEAIRDRVSRFLRERMPLACSQVVFASARQLEVVEFEGEPFSEGEHGKLQARLGEPYFTPLLMALDSHEPYAVVHCDRDLACGFEVAEGQATLAFKREREAVFEAGEASTGAQDRAPSGVSRVNPAHTRSAQTVGNRQNMPKYIADRADAAKQLAEERVVRAQLEFYRDCGRELESMMAERNLGNVILLGPVKDRHMLLSVLPAAVSSQVKALSPSTPGPVPDAKAILGLVMPTIEQLEAERRQKLLQAVEESGLTGIGESLRALQEGRAHTLLVAKSLDTAVFVDPNTNYVSEQRSVAETLGNGDDGPRRVDLLALVPQLAEQWGVSLEFVGGAGESKLMRDYGGLGALVRW